jgi:putative ABC transport system permease protein
VDQSLSILSLADLAFAFVPSLVVLFIMRRWSLRAGEALIANLRMLAQLLAVGYVLRAVFETDRPFVIAAVVVLMIGVASSIAIRPLRARGARVYGVVLVALATSGLAVLVLVTQLVLDLPRWFEPRFVVPLAGMIFANAMNTISLAAERFEAERERRLPYEDARHIAFDAALIPQINALLAVGIVSLPGMMTGQILSGVDPLIAVRYQIMVMCMVFSSAGLGAALYLTLRRSAEEPASS